MSIDKFQDNKSGKNRMTGTWVIIVEAERHRLPRVLGPYVQFRNAVDELYWQERILKRSGKPVESWAVWVAELESPELTTAEEG